MTLTLVFKGAFFCPEFRGISGIFSRKRVAFGLLVTGSFLSISLPRFPRCCLINSLISLAVILVFS